MKISLVWLKDYVSFDLPVDTLVHRLTMAGLEVEKIEKVAHDTVLELEITPNRPDCLNMIGIARELAAILSKPLKLPVFPKIIKPSRKCEITVEDKEGCRRYSGTLLENVNIEPAKDWLALRLSALDVRLVNNVVDITNFCLYETGQPLHAFDYDKLQGGRIVVRRAKKGEKIVTLDGVERLLDPTILVIADAEKPVAIAGIMGEKIRKLRAGRNESCSRALILILFSSGGHAANLGLSAIPLIDSKGVSIGRWWKRLPPARWPLF